MRAVLFVALTLVALGARAAGFIVNEQSAAATGRGGAVAARPDNAAAIFFNPAGLAALPGATAYAGVSAVVPSARFSPQDGGPSTSTDTGAAFVPSLYASYRLSELLAIGLGVSSPFGLAISWPASSPGRQIVREQALRTFFVSPVVAADLSRWAPGLLVGAGVDLVPAQVYLASDRVFGHEVATVELGGAAFGVGGRAGLSYAPAGLPGLTAGVAYRSPVRLAFSGEANFEADDAFRSELPPDGEVTTAITLPQSVLGGVSYQLGGVELELDVNWIDWSVYDALDIALPDGSTTSAQKAWRDTLVVRAGAELHLGALVVRAGYAHDPTPVPAETLDFTLPDVDRNLVTAGVGYALPMGFHLDAAALWVLPAEHATARGTAAAIHGTYEVSALVFALALGFSLEPPG